jgi:hypothetical protein
MSEIKKFTESTPKHNQEFIGITNFGKKSLYVWKYGSPQKLKIDKCNCCKQNLPNSEGEYLVEWI